MRSRWLLTCVALAALSGCSTVGTTSPGPATLPAPSVATATAAGLPTPSAGTSAASGVPANATALKMADLARAQLATTLGVTPEQVAIASVEPVQWRDASLGCPKPNVDYVPMTTPGFRITLHVGDGTYEYHADQLSRVVQCGTGQE